MWGTVLTKIVFHFPTSSNTLPNHIQDVLLCFLIFLLFRKKKRKFYLPFYQILRHNLRDNNATLVIINE